MEKSQLSRCPSQSSLRQFEEAAKIAQLLAERRVDNVADIELSPEPSSSGNLLGGDESSGNLGHLLRQAAGGVNFMESSGSNSGGVDWE